MPQTIVVLDFGSQYTQVIARRIREANVFSSVLPYNSKLSDIRKQNPIGIVLSGGPASVFAKDSPKPKAKPLDAKQIWRRDDRNAVQREVDAQYGRTPWNKKGSLGT
mgnify:CR=1 FL=1